MAKPEEGTILSEMLSVGLYKRNQGRLSRQLTAAGVALIAVAGAYRLSQEVLLQYTPLVRFLIPAAVTVLGLWIAFRVVNVPRFAEFLISVEGEMNKVAWSSKAELYRATVVVIAVMAFMMLILKVFDALWVFVFTSIGVLRV